MLRGTVVPHLLKRRADDSVQRQQADGRERQDREKLLAVFNLHESLLRCIECSW